MRLYHLVTPAVLALSAIACGGDSTGPDDEITLYFCHVAWAAYQNEGESWTALPPNPQQATFVPSERLAIATVSTDGPQLTVRFLTVQQAQATFICNAPTSTPPTRELHGSVAGVAPDANVSISMGRNGAGANAMTPTFQIGAVGDGPSDLVATHNPPFTDVAGSLSLRTDKMIVRRGENHANGATMPVLDFSSPEAFAPQANTLTVDGLGIVQGQRLVSQWTVGVSGVPYNFSPATARDGDVYRGASVSGSITLSQ
jgi:hypothetical protein